MKTSALPHLMIVEDEPELAAMIAELMSDYFSCTLCSSLGDVMRVLEADPGIDIILSDVHIPGADSETLLKTLLDRRRDIPVIIMSGLATTDTHVQRLLQMGAVAAVTKPLPPPQQLAQILGRHLREPLSLMGRRILIVDDEPSIREILCEEFAYHGAFVRSAGSVPDAIIDFSKDEFDTVVSDIRMSQGSGMELLGILRANAEAARKIPPFFVVVTGFSDIGPSEILAQGASVMIYKPFDLGRVTDIISSLRPLH